MPLLVDSSFATGPAKRQGNHLTGFVTLGRVEMGLMELQLKHDNAAPPDDEMSDAEYLADTVFDSWGRISGLVAKGKDEEAMTALVELAKEILEVANVR